MWPTAGNSGRTNEGTGFFSAERQSRQTWAERQSRQLRPQERQRRRSTLNEPLQSIGARCGHAASMEAGILHVGRQNRCQSPLYSLGGHRNAPYDPWSPQNNARRAALGLGANFRNGQTLPLRTDIARAGTKQRFSGLSQPRQCGDDVLRTLVTGGPPVLGGGACPTASWSSRGQRRCCGSPEPGNLETRPASARGCRHSG